MRFLVFMGTMLFSALGFGHYVTFPLDAFARHFRCGSDYPHALGGQPPSIIEDQVTYPIVRPFSRRRTSRRLRATKTMFGGFYVLCDL